MRFRLRDILILMVMVAVYLTTGKYVFDTIVSEANRVGALTGALIGGIPGISVFNIGMFVVHQRSVRKAAPILYELDALLPWKQLSSQLVICIVFGVATILTENKFAYGAFGGASVVFWGTVLCYLWMSKVKVGESGIAYVTYHNDWSEIEVVRNSLGKIEQVVLKSPWGLSKSYVKRLLSTKTKVSIPAKQQDKITELFEQYS